MARDSGANLLRVWGGGLREKRAFYDLCDELGLLVWQEFPFACEFLGAFPRDAQYLAFVERECSDIVRQVRHHPSLLLWCGGNEFSRSRNRPLLQTLARVVRRQDGTRPFIPTSPGPGDAHNWHVWHGRSPIDAYRRETAPMLSEFGLQALPATETLAAIFGPQVQSTGHQSQSTIRNSLTTHHGDVHRLTRYAATVNNSSFTTQNSQLAQALGLQTAIEHMRRRKAEAGGVAVWQFNEPWPAISWAIVDYFGRPKLAYKRLKTWYAPLLVSLDFPVGRHWQPGDIFAADIWLINDSLTTYPNCTLKITLTTIHQSLPRRIEPSQFIIHKGLPRSIGHSQFTIASNHAACIGRIEHPLTAPPQHITATLRHGSKTLSENSYPLNWHDVARPSPAHQLRRWLAEWTLR